MSKRIAIVGAGIAGLAAARRLRAAGLACTLFDKSRGVGGRMATRRVEGTVPGGFHFDHGAQYFTAKGPRFRALVAQWRDAGQAAEWFDGAFVGTPGMSTPVNAMAGDSTIHRGCAVAALRRDADGWTIIAPDGPDIDGNGRFDSVILAMPSPQVAVLLASAGMAFPALEAVRYAPCWALMLGFRTSIALSSDRLRPEDQSVAWIAQGSGKPDPKSPTKTVVAHATPEWSRRRLEDLPETVTGELMGRVLTLARIEATPDYAVSHRWRYALVEQPAGTAFQWDEGARIGACGDWGLGPRIEAAFDSGEALATAIAGSLGAG
jgi:renalase